MRFKLVFSTFQLFLGTCQLCQSSISTKLTGEREPLHASYYLKTWLRTRAWGAHTQTCCHSSTFFKWSVKLQHHAESMPQTASYRDQILCSTSWTSIYLGTWHAHIDPSESSNYRRIASEASGCRQATVKQWTSHWVAAIMHSTFIHSYSMACWFFYSAITLI
jgi:hypothetical protein